MKSGKKVKSASSISSLWMIFKKADVSDKWLMTIGFIGATVNGLTTPVMLLITSKIMNSLAGASSSTPLFIHDVNKNAVYMLYMACISFVACFLEGYCWTRTGERQAARLRARYLKAVLRQDIEYFDMKVASTTEVVTSVSSDSIVIQDLLSEKMPNFIMNCATFVGGYLIGFFMMWRLALIVFPTVVLLIIPGIIYGRILISITRKIREQYNKAGAIAEQAISSIRTVYSFVGEQRTIKEFGVALEGTFKLGARQGLIKGIATGSNGVSFAIWAFMIWYGSKQVMFHGAKGGTIYAVGVSIITSGLAFGSAISNLRYFSEAISAGERILEVMDRVPKIDSESEEGEILGSFVGELEFKGVKFSYPSRPESLVLNDFNLKIPAGKIVALVGSSGSGKSTVVGLLERFYDPEFGSIQVDGVDIKNLKLKWLRSQMGLVSQEPALFATSVKENILFGKEDASMEEVVAAAKIANAHEFISKLPDGYDTQVGERGVQMSGGQKQRIAIARAVLKSPKILMLDEATSALDTESERIVQEALDAASVGRTSIIIAHRLSTVRNADIIAVVQDGRVTETGTHDELMRDEFGLYSSLVQLQQTKGGSDECSSTNSLTTVILSEEQSVTHKINERRSNLTLKSEEKPKPASPAPSFQRLLLLNAPEWKLGTVGCFGAMAFGAIQPLYALAMGSMISVFFLKNHEEIKAKTRTHSLLFLSLSFLSFLSNIAQHFSFGVMGEYLTKRVRERILSKILTFEVAWFDKDENSTGAICSRLAKDAVVVRSLVGDRMSLLVQTASAIVIACTLGLVTAWRLALVMMTVQPLIIVCFYSRKMLLKSMSSKAVKAQLESSKLAAEAVSNVRTVTAFSVQEKILRLFELTQEGPRKENIRQSWIAGIVLGISHSLTKCAFALSFWYGGRLVSHDLLTPRSLFQTFLVLVGTGRVIANAGSMTSDLAKAAETVSSVFAILDRQTCIEPEDPNGDSPKRLIGRVDIINIDFAYPSRPDVLIFSNFSLSIEAGKSTALVGRSGSGKSTIISLIERFYDPLMGSITIDNKDIKTYNLRCLRRHIAMVGQEPVLFAGTIEENIAYGVDMMTTKAEIEEAAKAANAHEFISSLKDGYKTWCGDKGTQLSGGQRQRIAIARAILKNPSILLLDEATSALDTQSERVVQDALEKVMIGRTCVVVAHRLSTIQDCDVIVVLEKGMVVEKGTHASLLEKGPGGSYFSLISLQQRNMIVDV